MKSDKLLEIYPKATSIVRKWLLDRMMESINTDDNVPEGFKEHMKQRGISDPLLISMIDKNPSMLFKVFDSIGIYAEVPLVIEPSNVMFTWDVFVEGVYPFAASKYNTRFEAEFEAVSNIMGYIEEHFDEKYGRQDSETGDTETAEQK